jgi:dolichol-phosphate mannosyltransferase
MKKVTLFLPMKNEEDSIPNLKKAVSAFENFLSKHNLDLEILIHDNDSQDRTWDQIEKWAEENYKIVAFRFNRDIGYQESLSLSFNHATGDAYIVLQSDLQDPPEIMHQMIERWLAGEKCIVGQADNRGESFGEKMGRNLFIRLFKLVGDFAKFKWFTDFYLLDRSSYVKLRDLPLINQFIRGRIITDIGIDSVIPYTRVIRSKGKSKFNFNAKYVFAFDALLLHGERLFRSLFILGFTLEIFVITSVIPALFCVIFGVTSTILLVGLTIILFLGIFLILSAITLEYLFRIYKNLHSADLNQFSRKSLYRQILRKDLREIY